MFTGLKSVIYPSFNLEQDKKFWEHVTGVTPYFNQPFYVGFSIGGSELGLDPSATSEGLTYPIAYWHVESAEEAVAQLIVQGATLHSGPRDVGGGMKLATLQDVSGNIFGVIDDPHAE